MRNWVILGLVAVVTLSVAGMSSADVPSALTSSVICRCVATGGLGASTQEAANKCSVSNEAVGPAENLRVEVTVRNVLGAVLAGSTVIATAAPMGGASYGFCSGQNPQTAISDGSGNATFVINKLGASLVATPTQPDLDYAVTAQGPGPGSAVTLVACPTKFSVIAFDENADLTTNLTDFAIFGTDFGAGNPRSDFNWDGVVNLTDFAIFGAHFGHSCAGL